MIVKQNVLAALSILLLLFALEQTLVDPRQTTWFAEQRHAIQHSSLVPSDRSRQMDELKAALLLEQTKLLALMDERATHQTDWLWRFSKEERLLVETLNLQIFEQAYRTQATWKALDLQWKHVKPRLGIFSPLCLYDVLDAFSNSMETLFRGYTGILGVSLVTVIASGPIMAWIILFLGMAALQIVTGYVIFDFLLALPSVLLDYAPTVPQFLLVEFGISTLAILFLHWMLQPLFAAVVHTQRGCATCSLVEQLALHDAAATARVSTRRTYLETVSGEGTGSDKGEGEGEGEGEGVARLKQD